MPPNFLTIEQARSLYPRAVSALERMVVIHDREFYESDGTLCWRATLSTGLLSSEFRWSAPDRRWRTVVERPHSPDESCEI